MVTITGNLLDIFGEGIERASVTFQLCNYGCEIPRVEGGMLAGVSQIVAEADGDGLISVDLNKNSDITPEGTYYTVTLRNENGDVVQTAAYTIEDDGDLAEMEQLDI